MDTFLFTLGIFLSVSVMMAIGIIFNRSPLKGSCGGVGGEACVCSEEEQQACRTGSINEEPSFPPKKMEEST